MLKEPDLSGNSIYYALTRSFMIYEKPACWSDGVMEYWLKTESSEYLFHYSITPSLQYSGISFLPTKWEVGSANVGLPTGQLYSCSLFR
jgi:hypothetical protein